MTASSSDGFFWKLEVVSIEYHHGRLAVSNSGGKLHAAFIVKVRMCPMLPTGLSTRGYDQTYLLQHAMHMRRG